MSEEYGHVEVADNTVLGEQPVEDGAAEASGRRGRPRDPGVIERDARVLDALPPGEAKTKSQLAGELGLEPNVVYLSLWRLHKDGQVQRTQRTWQRV